VPVRIVGMIGVAPPASTATVHIITGGISPDFLREFAQAHEAADYDLVLVGYTSQSAEGLQVASYAAAHTERLGYLIAHRPGFIEPTLATGKIATFDNLHGDPAQGCPIPPGRRVSGGHAPRMDRARPI